MKICNSVFAVIFASLYAQTVSAQLYFSSDNTSQLYTLNTTTGASALLGTTGVTSNTVGLTETNDPNILFGSTWTELSRINITLGTHTIVGAISGGAEGLAWDPTSSTLYGYINNNFFTIDPNTAATISTLASTPVEVEGLAYRNGFIYGFGGTNSDLYRYSIAGDIWSVVGNTGLSSDSTGLAWDPLNDVFYTKSGIDGNLYRLNPITAASTLIGPTGIPEGGGLAFVTVPEPSTFVLAALGVLGLGFSTLRKRYRRG